MAHFVFTGTDRADGLDTRMSVRPAHLEWLAANAAAIRIAGPFLSDDGKPIGSLLIIEAASQAEVEALVATDPYAHAGLFSAISIRPWRWVVGAPAA
ncbi:MAG: YciI family protein [Hyphomicrobiaceae bacterium]|nr:YciI family protein [Hyphomicrobiaceae bacterium]